MIEPYSPFSEPQEYHDSIAGKLIPAPAKQEASESATPRADAAHEAIPGERWANGYVRVLELARALELELAQMKRERDALHRGLLATQSDSGKAYGQMVKAIQERDQLRTQLEEAKAKARNAQAVCEEIENYAATATQTVLDDKREVVNEIFYRIKRMAKGGCAADFGEFIHTELQGELAAAQKQLEEERKRCMQMVRGKVADDQQHIRALDLISARQVEEVKGIRNELAAAQARIAELEKRP